MNSFKNPLTPTITEPVNLDRHIQELQLIISTLTWLEKCFARAYDSARTINGRPGLVYPQVWQGLGKDLLDVLPNDNLKSQCFFKVEDPAEVLEYVPYGYSLMRARVHIIFWFNLKEIDPDIEYNFTEILKGQIQRLLTNATLSDNGNVEIVRIFEGVSNVFRGYDLSQVTEQVMVYPYAGFRVETLITYSENCPDEAYSPPQLPGSGNGEFPGWESWVDTNWEDLI